MASKRLALYVGQCLPSNTPGLAKVTVKTLKLNEAINVYYSDKRTLLARDGGTDCKSGDTVLIEELVGAVDAPPTSDALKYGVRNVIYRYGDNTDPLSDLPVMGTEYRHLVDLEARLSGKEGGVQFDYTSSSERGWQEGRKDWSHKEPEIKRHDDGNREPHQW